MTDDIAGKPEQLHMISTYSSFLRHLQATLPSIASAVSTKLKGLTVNSKQFIQYIINRDV